MSSVPDCVSKITVGKIPESLTGPSTTASLSIDSDSSTSEWAVTASTITYGTTELNTGANAAGRAIIDVACPLLILQTDTFNSVIASIKKAATSTSLLYQPFS